MTAGFRETIIRQCKHVSNFLPEVVQVQLNIVAYGKTYSYLLSEEDRFEFEQAVDYESTYSQTETVNFPIQRNDSPINTVCSNSIFCKDCGGSLHGIMLTLKYK